MGSLHCVEPGAPAWADLGTAAGTTSAARFYCSLFGWSVVARHRPLDDAAGYWVFQRQGANVGGLAPTGSATKEATWTVYMGVADVDATAKAVVRHGGSVVTEPMYADAGRMAVCADPLGATFVLWQTDDSDVDGAEPTSFASYTLSVADAAAAKQFYCAVFGWEATTTPCAGGRTYTAFAGRSGRTVAAMVGMPHADQPDHDEPSPSPRWMVSLSVTDTDDTALRAAELGGTVMMAPVDLPNVGRMAVLNDPESAAFSVLQAA